MCCNHSQNVRFNFLGESEMDKTYYQESANSMLQSLRFINRYVSRQQIKMAANAHFVNKLISIYIKMKVCMSVRGYGCSLWNQRPFAQSQ